MNKYILKAKYLISYIYWKMIIERCRKEKYSLINWSWSFPSFSSSSFRWLPVRKRTIIRWLIHISPSSILILPLGISIISGSFFIPIQFSSWISSRCQDWTSSILVFIPLFKSSPSRRGIISSSKIGRWSREKGLSIPRFDCWCCGREVISSFVFISSFIPSDSIWGKNGERER